jgi:two-component system, cell cycle sensor histidine kinase and response regulator CckA
MQTNPISPTPNRSVEPLGKARGTGATILVVEDDDAVRAFVRMVLEFAGYVVVTATDGGQGLAEYMTDPDRFDLLLSDVVMPNRTGPELFEIVRRVRPGVRVLFMSAYTAGTSLNPVEMPPGAPLLEKPFSIDRLLGAVAEAFSQGNSPYA